MTPPKTHFEYLPRWDEKMSPGEAMRRFYSSQFPSETREVVIFYFEYFYGICPIFHPATFLCRLIHGSVDPLLIDVMRAKTARLITKYTGRRVDLDAIIENINRRLLLDLESPTFDYIRAVVLMTTLSGGECKFMSYNSLVCLACSMVTRLGWNSLDLCARDAKSIPWLEWAELETQRRTFWIVYQLDAYQALLADRPVSISDARLHTGTPGSDCTWDDISISQILHWPTRHLQSIDKATIINTGALSYTFIDVCDLTVLLSQINQFMWSIRQRTYAKQLPCRGDLLSGMSLFVDYEPDRKQPAVRSSLFELPRFRELHEALQAWCKRLVPADDLKGIGTTLGHFSQFGSLGHRQHQMRILGPYLGDSERRLREKFASAQSEEGASILFIDEIDSLAPSRTGTGSNTRLVAQLLTLMDGLKTRGRLVVIGATNRPNALDSALRRPGRFDREISIDVPDQQARSRILQHYLQRMPGTVDIEQLASATIGYVGADLSALCREAALLAISRRSHLTMADFAIAMRTMTASTRRGLGVDVAETKWSDVGGLSDVKLRLRQAVEWPTTHKTTMERLGVRPPRAATNRIDMIDSALLRPGRFDRILYVPPPDRQARVEILGMAKHNVDVEVVADLTEGFSGADLSNLSREAALLALRENLDASVVGMTHYQRALGFVQPSLKSDLMEYYSRMQSEYN
ncbi:hypothetical protein H4S04_000014 [Coemansia sp. S16]|nr:hypothetical protein H4S04_000014 [Coemansia sp. S16]